MQDTSWLDVYLSDIPHVIYQVADPNVTEGAQHATLADKGREAMGYLQVGMLCCIAARFLCEDVNCNLWQ